MPIARLDGHLTMESLATALEPIESVLGVERCALVFDVREMTGYDGSARERFVSWHQAHRARITRIAVVTHRTTWRMVIAAMALAARVEMRAFAELAEAQRWAELGQDRA